MNLRKGARGPKEVVEVPEGEWLECGIPFHSCLCSLCACLYWVLGSNLPKGAWQIQHKTTQCHVHTSLLSQLP